MSKVSRTAVEASQKAGLRNRVEAALKYISEHGLRTTKQEDGEEVELSPEEALEKAERIRKARSKAAQVLSRGRTLDTLDRVLNRVPDGFVGQLSRERDEDIARFEILGFEVYVDERAKDDTPHGTADGKVRIGDQILMVIREEEYAAIMYERARRKELRREAHKPASRKKALQEETPDVPIFSEVE